MAPLINGQRVVTNRGEGEMNAAGSCVNSRIGSWEAGGGILSGCSRSALYFYDFFRFCAQRCSVESASVFLTPMFCHPRFIFWSQSSTLASTLAATLAPRRSGFGSVVCRRREVHTKVESGKKKQRINFFLSFSFILHNVTLEEKGLISWVSIKLFECDFSFSFFLICAWKYEKKCHYNFLLPLHWREANDIGSAADDNNTQCVRTDDWTPTFSSYLTETATKRHIKSSRQW